MKFAYADPPYIGQAKKHYGKQSNYAGEVDHYDLLLRLTLEFKDGWALSCSSTTLQEVLGLCDKFALKPRVAAWVKPFAVFKPNVNPAYAWEPVVFVGGRKREREEPTVRDWMACNITLRRGLPGVKPDAFCFWLFSLLGMEPGDTLVDLYPGSGAVTKAWNRYQAQLWPPQQALGVDP